MEVKLSWVEVVELGGAGWNWIELSEGGCTVQ